MGMRVSAVTILIFGFLMSAPGAAQDGEFQPEWIQRPTSGQFGRFYPRTTARLPDGDVVLCCIPQDDGRLSCTHGLERPDGTGYGAMAMSISVYYRMSPASLTDFRRRGLSTYKLRMPIQVSGGRKLSPEAQQEISDFVCGA
jgi:hypothetical protein